MFQNKESQRMIISIGIFSILFVIGTTVPVSFADMEAMVEMVPDADAPHECVDRDECFAPEEVMIDVGGQVIWNNNDSSFHTVISGDLLIDPNMVGNDYPGGFDSGLVSSGNSFSYTFQDEGEYPYFCMIHPWMRGVIMVKGMVQEISIDVSTDRSAYSPGDTVTINAMVSDIDAIEISLSVRAVDGDDIISEAVTTNDGSGDFEFVLPDSASGVYTVTALSSIDGNDISDTMQFTVTMPRVREESPGGGCLIATATFGSELAPQVQFLREIRDGTLLSTSSGVSFMAGFNSLYYSFSPAIADLERQSPIFKEIVKVAITPMLASLSIMSLADEGSEASVLSLGISVIALNLGMYIGLPVLVIVRLYQSARRHR